MTATRTEIVKAQAALSERFPEFRFGQMVVGLAWSGRDFTNEALYDIADHEGLAAARELLAWRPRPLEQGCRAIVDR
jgi:hypothetical protein